MFCEKGHLSLTLVGTAALPLWNFWLQFNPQLAMCINHHHSSLLPLHYWYSYSPTPCASALQNLVRIVKRETVVLKGFRHDHSSVSNCSDSLRLLVLNLFVLMPLWNFP